MGWLRRHFHLTADAESSHRQCRERVKHACLDMMDQFRNAGVLFRYAPISDVQNAHQAAASHRATAAAPRSVVPRAPQAGQGHAPTSGAQATPVNRAPAAVATTGMVPSGQQVRNDVRLAAGLQHAAPPALGAAAGSVDYPRNVLVGASGSASHVARLRQAQAAAVAPSNPPPPRLVRAALQRTCAVVLRVL